MQNIILNAMKAVQEQRWVSVDQSQPRLARPLQRLHDSTNARFHCLLFCSLRRGCFRRLARPLQRLHGSTNACRGPASRLAPRTATTADPIFACRGAAGVEARIYQGGYMRANDIECLKQLRIGLVVKCTPKVDDLLAEWSLKGKVEQYLVFHEEAGRKSWDGLDLQSLKGTFATLHAEKVAAKDIPNVILQSLYDEFLKIHKSPCEALPQCFDEQAQRRILRARPAPAAEEEAALPVANVDLSDAEVLALAKEMHKTWSAAVGKKPAVPMLACLGC